jgi:hypothetical protein
MSEKKPRNVLRDTKCPKCGKLFFKHALRVHTPFCKGKTDTAGAAPLSAPTQPKRRAAEPQLAPAAAPAAPVTETPAKSGSWYA